MVGRSNNCQYAVAPEPVPRPCKRFSRRPTLHERFLKHLPTCSACRAVIEYLEKQSRIDKFVHEHRN
jgi:hypothetical protein